MVTSFLHTPAFQAWSGNLKFLGITPYTWQYMPLNVESANVYLEQIEQTGTK